MHLQVVYNKALKEWIIVGPPGTSASATTEIEALEIFAEILHNLREEAENAS